MRYGGAVVVGSGAFGWARLGKFGRSGYGMVRRVLAWRSWFGNTGHGTAGLVKAVVVRQRM